MATRRTARGKTRPAGKRPGLPRTTVVLRWCIVGVVLFVAFLYYQPLSSYLQTRSALNERTAEVQRCARSGRGCRRGSPTPRR